jgi:hypothetical protein
MGGWGDQWPIEWGGGLTRADRIHRALRVARGETGNPATSGTGPIGGIEDAYVRAKAETFASGDAAVERALNQNFGFLATDLLETLEERYGLDPAGTEQDRRDAVAAYELEKARADCPSLEAELKEISPLFSIITYDRDVSTVFCAGKWLAPRSGVPNYGYRVSQRWANFSNEYVMRVGFDVVANDGLPAPGLILRAAALLRERLPAWMDFWITNADDAGCSSDGGPDGFDVADFTCVEPGS